MIKIQTFQETISALVYQALSLISALRDAPLNELSPRDKLELPTGSETLQRPEMSANIK